MTTQHLYARVATVDSFEGGINAHKNSTRWGGISTRLLKASAIVLVFLIIACSSVTLFGRSPSLSTSSTYWTSDTRFAPQQVIAADRSPDWRQNLLPDLRYVTGKLPSGPSNVFRTACNLLYIAQETNRVAILPAEHAAWLPPYLGLFRMSNYWDLPRFTAQTGIPVIEWDDIRDRINENAELQNSRIGCWYAAEAFSPLRKRASIQDYIYYFGIETDLWPLPPAVAPIRGFEGKHFDFSPVITFDTDRPAREEWIASLINDRTRVKSEVLDPLHRQPPDVGAVVPSEQLLCFEESFFFMMERTKSAAFPHDIPTTANGALFREIGQHLHWTPTIEELGKEIIEYLTGSKESPFIAIHIRRGDFDHYFGKSRYQPISHYDELLEKLHVQMEPRWSPTAKVVPRSLPVILATNAEANDTEFWSDVATRGWKFYNHTEHMTNERHNDNWIDGILDAVVLGRAHGMVGSLTSSYSDFAMMRVAMWQHGEIIW